MELISEVLNYVNGIEQKVDFFPNNYPLFCYNVFIESNQTELLKEEVKRLKIRVAWLEKQLFGSKSERLDPNQKEFFEEGVEMGKPEALLDSEKTSEQEEDSGKLKKKRKRKTKAELFPKNLPVVEKETLIPAEVLANPEAFKKVGERYHDELDYQPGRLQWQRTVIPSYVPRDEKTSAPSREKAPESAVPNAMITAALAAHLVIDKHCDHLPHYRQSQRFFREQSVDLSRKTINAWVHSTAKHLSPIAEAIARELRSSTLIQVDETPMHYLIPGTGKAHTGYIWVMRNPATGAVYYHWEARRNAIALMDLLGFDEKTQELAFKGTLQCDGYICYETLANAYQSIELGACMTHIRRKFLDDESLKLEPWIRYLLKAIKTLYRIERRLRNTNAPPDQVQRTRQRYAQPIIAKIEQLLKEEQPKQRPASSCAKAINYALNQWEQIKLYLEDGELPIDNNGVENAIRPCKLGLKNYMFFGSLKAGENNVLLYTLLENCKASKINPRDYLEYVISALHKHPAEELTPAKVAALWQKPSKVA